MWHLDIWGSRNQKYQILDEKSQSGIRWTEIRPTAPYFFFVPKNFDLSSEYDPGWRVNEIFTVQQNCIKTDRDDLFFDIDCQRLQDRMTTFYSPAGLKPEFRAAFRVEESSSYDLLSRRSKTKLNVENIRPCLYRPFDWRWLYYAVGLTSRPAWDVMRHMIGGDNLGLLAKRQSKRDPFSYIWCAKGLVESCVFESAYANNSIFPLYLVSEVDSDQRKLGKFHGRQPNLGPKFLSAFAAKLKVSQVGEYALPVGVTPEDIFHYAYGVFHSPSYRSRYADFLKIDFPRLPLTSRLELFHALSRLGGELVALHLLESPKIDRPITTYNGPANPEVEKVSYARGTVWLDKGQTRGFRGVPEVVWNFDIGGYPVCDKWLKDRKGRTLSKDDIAHYHKIVVALNETIRIMTEIDKLIDAHGGWPGAFITSQN